MNGAQDVIAALIERSWSVACGESLTGGLVCAHLASVPGCSAVLRGGVVAYQPGVKEQVLKVPAEVLAGGLVSAPVAAALAEGAARTMGAEVGIGTTGAAGPEPHDGAPPGSAWVAVCLPGQSTVTEHVQARGDRQQVREQVAGAALALARRLLTHASMQRE